MKTNALQREALKPAGNQGDTERLEVGFRVERSKEEDRSDWPQAEDLSQERHYSIDEISTLWGLSHKTICRIFQDEPGVIEFGTGESRSKRAYITRRIPESVMKRVHRRLRKTA